MGAFVVNKGIKIDEEQDMPKKIVELNGKKITKEELGNKQKDFEGKKGAKVEEVSKGVYRTKLQG